MSKPCSAKCQRALHGRVLLAPDHLVHLGQPLAQHGLGLRLQGEIERGVDGEVLGGEVLGVVALGELLLTAITPAIPSRPLRAVRRSHIKSSADSETTPMSSGLVASQQPMKNLNVGDSSFGS